MRRLTLALALTIAPLPASAATWTTSPIDPQSAWTISLLVDDALHGHALYWTPGAFKYAYYDGSAWTVDTIPSPGALAENGSAATRLATPSAAQLIFVGRTSLALRPETPWLAYMKVVDSHYEDGPLKVSHKEDGAWVTEHIDDHSVLGVHIAAGDGGIYLAYQSRTLGSRFMIRNGTWTADPPGSPYNPIDLRLDRNGTPWVLYFDSGALRIARRDGPGLWTSMPVDNMENGTVAALQFDSQNRPCVAYSIGSPGTSIYRLIYARWLGTDWLHTWVAEAGDRVACESFVLDASDEPWIAYRDFGTFDANVVHRSSGTWNVDLVDTPTGSYASLTLDPLGRHWMAYNRSAEGLRMARTVSPTGIGDPAPLAPSLRVAIAGANPLRASSNARLRIESPAAGTVRVEAFDLSGRRIGAARSWNVGAGITEFPWSAPGTHGLCLVRATMGGRSAIARVMVVR